MSKLEFKLDKIMFRSKDNGFTIGRVFPINKPEDIIVSNYGNISIKGIMVDLIKDAEYECVITGEENSKYGVSYNVSGVRPLGMGEINTDDEMLIFIKTMIGKGVYDKLKKTNGVCEIVKNLDVSSLVKIKGIGKKIANKIIEIWKRDGLNSKFISELLDLGFNEDHIDKINTEYNDLSYALNTIKTNPYKLILDGLNIRLMVIDKVAIKLGIKNDDIRRVEAYVFKAIKDESIKDYRSYLNINEIEGNKIIKSVIANAGIEKYTESLNILKSKEVLIQIDNNIGLKSVYLREKGLIEQINRIANCEDEFAINDIDKEIEYEEKLIGFSLTDKQKMAIKTCIQSNFTLIKGHAGTGKTTIAKIILNILEKRKGNTIIKQCALSGKAAQVLSKSTGREAGTIHRLLEKQGDEKETIKSIDADILVIDELSMVDIGLFKSLLSAARNGVKIICMGDNNQLPSLAYGKLIDDISMFDNVCVVELTEVHRQALESGIIVTANKIREGANIIDAPGDSVIGNKGDMKIYSKCNPVDDTVKKTVELYDKDNKDSTQVICATSALCYDINKRIQRKVTDVNDKFITVNAYGNIPKYNDDVAKYRIFKNDKIMIIKNMYNISKEKEYLSGDEVESGENLYNGNIGTLVKISKEYVVVSINGKEYVIEDEAYNNIQLAYACTCHKLQGSSADDVIVCMTGTYAEKYLISNEWLYTAITRSKRSCYMYGEFRDIQQAVKTRHINKKTTFMELLLK